MNHPTPEHVAMRDQILALLRDRHVMTTTEIQEALPRETAIHRASPTFAALMGAPAQRSSFQREVYPQLAAMARLGIIQRVPVPGYRPVAWMLVTPQNGGAGRAEP